MRESIPCNNDTKLAIMFLMFALLLFGCGTKQDKAPEASITPRYQMLFMVDEGQCICYYFHTTDKTKYAKSMLRRPDASEAVCGRECEREFQALLKNGSLK